MNTIEITKLKLAVSVVLFLLKMTTWAQQVKVSVNNGNWSNASTWSPNGVPNNNAKVKIYHNVTVNTNVTTNDTIIVYGTLNLANNCTVNLSNGNLLLASNAGYTGNIGTVGSGAKINGPYIVQRYLQRCDGYSNYGMPFDVNTTDLDWYYCNNCMPGWSNIYLYDETQSGSLNNGWFDTINGSIPRGRGFFYWYSNYAGGMNFPRTISVKGSTDLQSSFNFNITRTGARNSNNGHNLIANPFAGTLDWLSPGFTKTGINGAIYTWNNCSSVYASYVSGVSVNGGSRYIAPMQGFWVQAASATPALTVDRTALTTTTVSLLRQSADSIKNVMKISLGEDEIAIRLDAQSDDLQNDLTDAVFYLADNSRLYSSCGADSVNYAINSINDKGGKVFITSKGNGTLSITGVSSFENNYDITLTDLNSGAKNFLNYDGHIIIKDTNAVSFQKKYAIEFSKRDFTGIKSSRILNALIYSDNENINIRLPARPSSPVDVTVTDLLGRNIYTGKTDQAEFSLPRPGQPVIVLIKGEGGTSIKKVF